MSIEKLICFLSLAKSHQTSISNGLLNICGRIEGERFVLGLFCSVVRLVYM